MGPDHVRLFTQVFDEDVMKDDEALGAASVRLDSLVSFGDGSQGAQLKGSLCA